jgi:hypothetical protein
MDTMCLVPAKKREIKKSTTAGSVPLRSYNRFDKQRLRLLELERKRHCLRSSRVMFKKIYIEQIF